MFSRAHIESRKKALSRKKLIKARLDYMKIPQIASDSDGEDGDDVMEDMFGEFEKQLQFSYFILVCQCSYFSLLVCYDVLFLSVIC